MKCVSMLSASVKLAMGCLCVAAMVKAAEPPAGTAEQVKPADDLSTTAQPRVSTSPTATPGSAADVGKDKPAGPDRLQLDTTIVTGNRELPKVLYIVPWKKADIGELPQPFNSLLDEVLAPVDRDVFRREIGYFGVITEQARATLGGAPAEQQGVPASERIRSEK
jgi:hypothetical protein